MKKIFLILCVCLCELCYSQEEAQHVFIKVEDEISYDKSTLDNTLKQLLSIDSQLSTEVYKEEISEEENSSLLRLHEKLGDYRILEGNLLVYVKDEKITRINGTYYPSVEIMGTTPLMTESEVLEIAETEVFGSQTGYDFQYEIEKVISKNYLDYDDNNLYYAYRVLVSDRNNVEIDVEVIIDENTGKILWERSLRICDPGPCSSIDNTSIITYFASNCVLSPNPVKDILTLTLPSANNEIKIFDLQGKLLLQQNVGFSAEVNVSMLPAGTYVLVVNGESYKFVKE